MLGTPHEPPQAAASQPAQPPYVPQQPAPQIGHCHCHIILRGGEYFILDDNSKNHTTVNGTVITPGTEVKIVRGQIIMLADEEFEFKLF